MSNPDDRSNNRRRQTSRFGDVEVNKEPDKGSFNGVMRGRWQGPDRAGPENERRKLGASTAHS